MKFYNVKTRQPVEVPDDSVTVVTMKNGKMFKILSREEADRLSR